MSVTTKSDIEALVRTLTPTQLYEVMVQLKGLQQANPGQVRKLLEYSPQLSYAILEMLLQLGLVSTTTH
jgi:hypothetical protein